MARDQGSAEVKQRGADILIVASAMCGAGRITDWETFQERTTVDVSDALLGAALRRCLLSSRSMSAEWMAARINAPDYRERLTLAFGLASSRSLFSGMKDVSVEWGFGEVNCGPSRNRGGGRFDGFEAGADAGHEDVVVAFSRSDPELGAALREALRRCV